MIFFSFVKLCSRVFPRKYYVRKKCDTSGILFRIFLSQPDTDEWCNKSVLSALFLVNVIFCLFTQVSLLTINVGLILSFYLWCVTPVAESIELICVTLGLLSILSLPSLFPTQTSLVLEPKERCICNVTDILYSYPAWDWDTISAYGKHQFNGPTGWEAPQLLGKTACLKKNNRNVSDTSKKQQEEGKSGSIANVLYKKKAKGYDNVLVWALAAPHRCRYCMLKFSEMWVQALFTCLTLWYRLGVMLNALLLSDIEVNVQGGNPFTKNYRAVITQADGEENITWIIGYSTFYC